MSLLPADVNAALSQLVEALQSKDNTIRSHAEENLTNEWVVARPELLLMGLVEQLRHSENTIVCWYHASGEPEN